jgi:hypothetical protein
MNMELMYMSGEERMPFEENIEGHCSIGERRYDY